MRVSVSKVDQYLYYMRNEHKTLDEVRADIMGTSQQTPEMLMGIAFHRIFEEAGPGFAADEIEKDGFTFRFTGDMEVPVSGVPEVRCEHTYEIDGQPITVRGRCDRVLGREVVDYKMVKRFDEQKYVQFQDSFQWRAYLDMLDADQFRYALFTKKIPRGQSSVVEITDMQTLLFYRYPGMRKDIEQALRGFLRFTHDHVPEWWHEQARREHGGSQTEAG